MISDIMQASENDSKTVHKLIRMQRSNSNINTNILILDGTKYTEDELMDGDIAVCDCKFNAINMRHLNKINLLFKKKSLFYCRSCKI
jgi:hypothetical protein